MELNALPLRKGYTKPAKRVGRGIGSGKGVRCTKGNKGAKARAGGTKKIGFEGGQTPLYRRVPKFRGFKTMKPNESVTVTIMTLEKHFQSGDTVTIASLVEKNLVNPKFYGFKVVSKGELTKSLTIVGKASASAKAMIEDKGGKVEVG
jgi:large subunit ribosomal protein L15